MAWGYKCLVARTLLGAVRETAATGCSQSQGLKLCFQTCATGRVARYQTMYQTMFKTVILNISRLELCDGLPSLRQGPQGGQPERAVGPLRRPTWPAFSNLRLRVATMFETMGTNIGIMMGLVMSFATGCLYCAMVPKKAARHGRSRRFGQEPFVFLFFFFFSGG